MSIAIRLTPRAAKFLLRLNFLNHAIVVCRGYNEDCENFTELVWKDDYNLDFYDRETYQEFQLWTLPNKYKDL